MREGEGFAESLLWLERNQALSHKLPQGLKDVDSLLRATGSQVGL